MGAASGESPRGCQVESDEIYEMCEMSDALRNAVNVVNGCDGCTY